MSYVVNLLYGLALGTMVGAWLGAMVNAREIKYTVSLLVASVVLAGIAYVSNKTRLSSAG
jgi:uncharacterized membrane protein YfcA